MFGKFGEIKKAMEEGDLEKAFTVGFGEKTVNQLKQEYENFMSRLDTMEEENAKGHRLIREENSRDHKLLADMLKTLDERLEKIEKKLEKK